MTDTAHSKNDTTWRIRRMTPEDYDDAYALWDRTPGMHLHSLNNTYGGIVRLLDANPNTCLVAVDGNDSIVATALGATDGRKGYLYHIAVDEQWRGQGIGSTLVHRIEDAFQAVGIVKVGILVVTDNEDGKRFWKHQGWSPRPDVVYFDHNL